MLRSPATIKPPFYASETAVFHAFLQEVSGNDKSSKSHFLKRQLTNVVYRDILRSDDTRSLSKEDNIHAGIC